MESKVKKKVNEFLPYCFTTEGAAEHAVRLLKCEFNNKVRVYKTGLNVFVEKHRNSYTRQNVHALLISNGGKAATR